MAHLRICFLLIFAFGASLSAQPFGFLDVPASGTTGLSGAMNVLGWALSTNEVYRVATFRDAVPGEGSGWVYIGDAPQVPESRPDVAARYGGYPRNSWGFGM